MGMKSSKEAAAVDDIIKLSKYAKTSDQYAKIVTSMYEDDIFNPGRTWTWYVFSKNVYKSLPLEEKARMRAHFDYWLNFHKSKLGEMIDVFHSLEKEWEEVISSDVE